MSVDCTIGIETRRVHCKAPSTITYVLDNDDMTRSLSPNCVSPNCALGHFSPPLSTGSLPIAHFKADPLSQLPLHSNSHANLISPAQPTTQMGTA